MSKIIVAGAGHGGLVAAYHLAVNGEDVTVFEKNKQDNLGYDWQDSFDYKCFSYADMPIPEIGMKSKIPFTFVPCLEPYTSFTQAKQPGKISLHMYRKDIYEHLVSLCCKVGVNFKYNTNIKSAILFGNRVCGIKTDKGDFFADLVIDAAGMYSPVKNSLPDYLNIQKDFGGCEVLHSYRAYYKKTPGVPDPENVYQVLLNEDGNIGLSWVITRDDFVDVLIGRFGDFNISMAKKAVDNLRNYYPNIGSKILHGGQIADIPVRQPVACMIADGYAAVGDSACMTVPMMGSGITNSIMAGKMLADAAISDENKTYSASVLWEYEKQYFKDIGNTCCGLELFKVLLNELTPDDIVYLINEDILSSEDVNFSTNDTTLAGMVISSGHGIPGIVSKAKKIKNNDVLFKKLVSLGANAAKLQKLKVSFPSDYNPESVKKWCEKYNAFFNSITVEDIKDEKLI